MRVGWPNLLAVFYGCWSLQRVQTPTTAEHWSSVEIAYVRPTFCFGCIL